MADSQGGAGPSSSKMKVPTDFQVPRRASAKIGTYGPAAREEREGGGGNLRQGFKDLDGWSGSL